MEAHRIHGKEVRRASKSAWRTFWTTADDLPMSARLHTALTRDPKIKLGSPVAPLESVDNPKGNI